MDSYVRVHCLRLDHLALDLGQLISPLWISTYGDEDLVSWWHSFWRISIVCQTCTCANTFVWY